MSSAPIHFPPAPPAQQIPLLLTMELITTHFVPINPRTLRRWISAGEFPKPDLKHGKKLVFWRRETVEAWFADYSAKHAQQ